jgi:hypothetical protein
MEGVKAGAPLVRGRGYGFIEGESSGEGKKGLMPPGMEEECDGGVGLLLLAELLLVLGVSKKEKSPLGAMGCGLLFTGG